VISATPLKRQELDLAGKLDRVYQRRLQDSPLPNEPAIPGSSIGDSRLFLELVSVLEGLHPERRADFIPRLERFCAGLRYYFSIHPERRHELRGALRCGLKLDELTEGIAGPKRNPRDGPRMVFRPELPAGEEKIGRVRMQDAT
jgi:hypothetical protein